MTILEHALLSEPALKLTLKLEVQTVLPSIPIELSLLEVSTVIGGIVFDGKAMPVWLVMLKQAHKDLLFEVELPIPFLLFPAIDLPSKNGLSQMENFGLFDSFLVLLSEFIDFLDDFQVVDLEVFFQLGEITIADTG